MMIEKITASNIQGKWSDREIFNTEQDRFGSQDYAKVLADRATTADTPLTIGIFGRWGSGKTSLMRLVADSLNKRDKPIKNIWINVWQLSNREELWNAFLQALFSQVHKGLPWYRRWTFDWSLFRERVRWGELLRVLLVNSYRVVVAVTPILLSILWPDDSISNVSGLLALALDPLTGGVVSLILGLWLLVAPAVQAAKEKVSIDFDVILKESPYEIQVTELQRLQGQFERLVKTWVRREGRLVVFIDDLDRCTPDKIPEVLEAIKLFTNTPRCVYIIGLDHEIVTQGIEAKYKFSENEANEYLEKIVQIPFQLPPLDDNRIEYYVKGDYVDVQYICTTAPEVFSKGLEPNPRKVKRALNIYRTLWELAEVRVNAWEMYPVDPELLAKMVVIQSRFRHLYAYLVKDPNGIMDFQRYTINTRKDAKKLISIDLFPDSDYSNGDIEALGSLLRAGNQEFIEDKVSAYIYLTEGVSDLMRPSRQERETLLSNDPERVRQQVDMILTQAANDQERERLTQNYRRLLQTEWDKLAKFRRTTRYQERMEVTLKPIAEYYRKSRRKGEPLWEGWKTYSPHWWNKADKKFKALLDDVLKNYKPKSDRELVKILLDQQAGYSDAAVESAGYALAWFEIEGLTAHTRAEIFQEHAESAQGGVETEANQSNEFPGVRGYLHGLLQALQDDNRPEGEKRSIMDLLLSLHCLPELVHIPVGPFLMGTSEEQGRLLLNEGYQVDRLSWEQPQHRVELSEYWIGKFPITNRQYQFFIREGQQASPKYWDGDQFPEGKAEHPVVNVSWKDAVAYCQWLSQKTGRNYCLPTEAEWEKAARGDQGWIYPWGNEWDLAKCNSIESGSNDAIPIGQFSPQGDSLYHCADMAGNIWEWCADWFDEQAYQKYIDGVKDPLGAESGERRSLRGGAFVSDRLYVRCAARGSGFPDLGFRRIGFRVAASAPIILKSKTAE